MLAHPSSQSEAHEASPGSLDRVASLWYERPMDIGKRLRGLREARGYSEGEIARRAGFLRCYVSRIECGHAAPKLQTLGKRAKALDLELHQLFFRGKGEPVAPEVAEGTPPDRQEEKVLELFRRMPPDGKDLFLALAREAVKRWEKHE